MTGKLLSLDELLTVREVADMLKVSPKFVRRELISKGHLSVIPLGISAKADRIRLPDLLAFIEKRRTTKCCTNEVKRGGLSLSAKGKSLPDPLGLPSKGRRQLSSVS